jgi:hypothetical protein
MVDTQRIVEMDLFQKFAHRSESWTMVSMHLVDVHNATSVMQRVIISIVEMLAVGLVLQYVMDIVSFEIVAIITSILPVTKITFLQTRIRNGSMICIKMV